MDDIKLGALIFVDAGTADVSPVPLEQTRVTGTIIGSVTVVQVEQRFRNPFKDLVELEYLFPLPEKAAVVDYTIQIGERTIQAEIAEKEVAQRIYQEAVAGGKRASLMEQRRPNLFSVQIGNVQPGEAIVTRFTYEDRLSYDDGAYTFVFPMGITPKYHTASVTEAQAKLVDRPFERADTPVAPVEIQLTVDAGFDIQSMQCPTHNNVILTTTEQHRFTAELTAVPNKDFRLKWTTTTDNIGISSWGSCTGDGEIHLITLLPPRTIDAHETTPREFIFVLDRSGSMSGYHNKGPIDQAVNALRACIRALNASDTFTIQAFDDQIEWFSQHPLAVTQSNIESADHWLEGIKARGGTEIVGAIAAALSIPTDDSRIRYVIFLTDGAISAEEQALKQIARKRGRARIFTFGIGPSVNRAMLVKMAEIGRGVSEFLGTEEDIEGTLIRFQDRVSYPVLFDVQLHWQNAHAWDIYPAILPDLYAGQPLEVATRLTRDGDASVILSGKLGDRSVSYTVDLPSAETESVTINRLWARARVESLMDSVYSWEEQEKIRQQIITLGLQHRLVTAYTSFVAVDSEIATNEGELRQIRVSGPLPEGLNPEAFAPPPAPMMYDVFDCESPPDGDTEYDRLYAKPIEGLDLNVRVFNSLKRTGITSIGDVLDMLRRGADAMLAIRNFDEGSLEELGQKLIDKGYRSADGEILTKVTDREQKLRQFARSQNVNGSWDDSVEMTCAVLLTFIREEHTAHKGNYRQQIKKALEWLEANATDLNGVMDYAVKRVIAEHNQTDLPPAPDMPQNIVTLDDLRLVALLAGEASAPETLVEDSLAAQAWLAPGKPL